MDIKSKMAAEPPAGPDKEALKRLQRIIVVVLVSLTVVSVVIAVLRLWPVPWIESLGLGTSLRLRITGVIVVLGGGVLLPALLVAVLIKRLLARGAGRQ